MGIEDYRVSLRSRSASQDSVAGWIARVPFSVPDPEGGFLPQNRYFRIDDGRHVLEVEVSDGEPVDVSVRFMLCNPPSVEPAFLALVGELVSQFDMEIHDQEGNGAESWWLPPERFEQFKDSTLWAIPRRRAEWVMHFGPEQFPAGAEEAGRWIIEGVRPEVPATLLSAG